LTEPTPPPPTIHDETSLGGLFQVPINTEVLSTVYDPLNSSAGSQVFSGGIHWWRRADGQVDNLYRVFLRTDPNTFGKAGGLGDLEALCDPAPLQIGNRVWLDADVDGLQDPGEAGLSGLTVAIYSNADGVCDGTGEVLLGSVVTAANGTYLFTDANVTGGLQYGTKYCLRIVVPGGFGATVRDATPVGDGRDDVRDSDGDPAPFPGSVVTSFTTGGPGNNRHVYDFGFRALEFDYGDLPDPPYATLAASNGPNHEITTPGNCYLGGPPDSELDGQPNAPALGDDNDLNGDDEDGVLFLTPLIPGRVADIQVASSGACVLNAWIDFNSNGNFADPGELIASNLALVAGNNLLDNVPVPAGATGVMAARFRVTNLAGQGGASPTGPATTGEVEDYVLAALGDFVWNDSVVGQGIQLGGDTPVPGLVVHLLANDGVTPILDGAGVAITATTDANGNYEFPGLPTLTNSGLPNPGDYRVRFELPPPFVDFSPRDNTTDDLDSDADQVAQPIAGLTQIVSLTSGVDDVDLDAGLRAPTVALVTSAAAYVDGGAVVFEFSTGYEALSAGFEVLRHEPETDEYVAVSERLIPALLGSPQGGVYRVVDEGAPFRETLRYVIVEHQGDGRTQVYGPYPVQVTDRGSRAPLDASFAALPHVSPRFGDRMAQARGETAERGRRDRSAATRLSSRSWTLQVGVRDSGLYRVSVAAMAAALGVPESRVRFLIDHSLVEMENRGQPVAWWTPNGSDGDLFFYGEAIDSLYTLENTYWLRLYRPGQRMDRSGGPLPPAAPGGVFVSTERFEEDVIPAITGVRETEVDHWFWGGINAQNPNTILAFDVAVPDAAAGAASMTVRFAGATDGVALRDHHAIVRVNGTEVGTAAWGGIEFFESTFAFDGALLTPLTSVEIEGVLAEGSTASIFFVDGFDVDYPRFYRALDDRLLVRGDGNPIVTVEGFTSPDVAVFDLTDPEAPVRVTNVLVEVVGSGVQASFFPTTAATPYLVTTETSALPTTDPRFVAPAIDLRATYHAYEHVVIAPEAWRLEAEDLAAYRSGMGLSSLAVSIEEVYDAFSDGIVTPWAVRDFLSYARENWSQGPDYAVLAGRGTFDPRDLLGGGDNFIPVVLVGTPYGLVATDNVLADLEAGDSVPEVALGRLPIVSAAELATYVDKLEAYDGSQGPWRGRALLLADNPDTAGDFPLQSDVVASLLTAYDQKLVYLSEMGIDDARAALQESWNAGVQLINYVGHGGVTQAAAEGLVRATDVGLLANGDRLPVVSALTCIVGRSDVPNLESLAEALVLDADGGAIAVWAPTGISFGGAAHTLNVLYAEAIAAAAPDTPLGEIVLQTLAGFEALGGSPEMLDAYAIAGDPAVALP
ncbi:MAG: C25 family cysteine peptidase, partial [Acidobacteriota bacterium]|nr:C25 family cysteine peptidase [Acidobacteriota bacterium]